MTTRRKVLTALLVVACILLVFAIGYVFITELLPAITNRLSSPDPVPAEVLTADSETSSAFVAEASGSGLWLTVSKVSVSDCVAPAYALVLPLEEGELHKCPGEPEHTCVAATREKDHQGMIPGFCGVNPTDMSQDGYRWDSEAGKMVTGIPPRWSGYMEGFTFRRTAVSNQPSQPATPPAPGATPLPSQPSLGQATVTTTSLNVRTAPSQTAPVLRTVSNGTVLDVFAAEVTTNNGTWLRISTASEWVAGWLTNWEGSVPPAPVQPIAPPVPPSATCPPNGVNAPSGLKWTQSGNDCLWNTYNDSDGQPIQMTLMCQQDGEFVDSSGPHSPIPQGTHQVTGITARPCVP